MYNTLTNEWQSIANLNVPRCYGSMVCLNGKLYVLGGESHYTRSELSVECFDPANEKWIQETTIPMPARVRNPKHPFDLNRLS